MKILYKLMRITFIQSVNLMILLRIHEGEYGSSLLHFDYGQNYVFGTGIAIYNNTTMSLSSFF